MQVPPDTGGRTYFWNHDTVWKVWVGASSRARGRSNQFIGAPEPLASIVLRREPSGLCVRAFCGNCSLEAVFGYVDQMSAGQSGTEEEHPFSPFPRAKTPGKILYYGRVSGKRIDYPLNKPQVLISALLHT